MFRQRYFRMPVIALLISALLFPCMALSAYIDNGDGTITDTLTNLRWQKGNAQRSWYLSLRYCEELELGGYTDWRPPNIRELESIVDYGLIAPAINPIFTCGPEDYYWSSTTANFSTRDVWVVDFQYGYSNTYYKGTNLFRIRCVRGGLPNCGPFLYLLLLE